MLEFYYDFLDRFFYRCNIELIQMDTNSNYMAISGESLKDIVRPELKNAFEAKKKEWLVWDKWSSHTSGLFNVQCEGKKMIALCSKCYYINDGESKKQVRHKRNIKETEQYHLAALQSCITWRR